MARMKKIIWLLTLCLTLIPTYAQREEAVAIRHQDAQGRGVALAGTLTLPDGKAPRGGWPAMVLITGSGPQNRDEELVGHKPFKVIADYMALRGVATLRCDDRGVGESDGAFADVVPQDLVDDILAQWDWLSNNKKINRKKIGLLGHSEGGLLAPMAAVKNPKVAFVVMMAGPGLPMRQTLLDQNMKIFQLNGVTDTLVERRLAFMRHAFDAADSIAQADTAQLVKRMNLHFRKLKDSQTQGLTKEQKQSIGLTTAECYGWALTMAQPYMLEMMRIDPRDYLTQLTCPLLALNGDLDCQVDAQSNLLAVQKAREGKPYDWGVHLCTGMNHLFQQCQTGAVSEYEALGQAPSNEVLQYIAEWLGREGVITSKFLRISQ